MTILSQKIIILLFITKFGHNFMDNYIIISHLRFLLPTLLNSSEFAREGTKLKIFPAFSLKRIIAFGIMRHGASPPLGIFCHFLVLTKLDLCKQNINLSESPAKSSNTRLLRPFSLDEWYYKLNFFRWFSSLIDSRDWDASDIVVRFRYREPTLRLAVGWNQKQKRSYFSFYPDPSKNPEAE